jgi:pyridoxamine 5'-phosphate oxidase
MIDNKELAQLRRHYSLKVLSKNSVKRDPFEQFADWMNEALNSIIIDPNAMTLATVGEDLKPALRIVLLKEFDHSGFVFYTNYQSKKGSDLSNNPAAVLHFFWRELERQVIISGVTEKIPKENSEQYFRTRPLDSQLSAWASAQSSIIPNRSYLEQRFNELKSEFKDSEVPMPPFWGGYRLVPERFEFWQGRENRLHDRICFRKTESEWEIVRLAP